MSVRAADDTRLNKKKTLCSLSKISYIPFVMKQLRRGRERRGDREGSLWARTEEDLLESCN